MISPKIIIPPPGVVFKALWQSDTHIIIPPGVVFKALWQSDTHIISCGDDYCIKLWDIRSLKHGPVENFLGHTSEVRTIVRFFSDIFFIFDDSQSKTFWDMQAKCGRL
jgi:WD40 repeat protein